MSVMGEKKEERLLTERFLLSNFASKNYLNKTKTETSNHKA